jgi:hypothetical protein
MKCTAIVHDRSGRASCPPQALTGGSGKGVFGALECNVLRLHKPIYRDALSFQAVTQGTFKPRGTPTHIKKSNANALGGGNDRGNEIFIWRV